MKFDGNGQSLLDVPEEAVLEVSDDGSVWQGIATIHKKAIQCVDGNYYFEINAVDVQAKNIRYRIKKQMVIGGFD